MLLVVAGALVASIVLLVAWRLLRAFVRAVLFLSLLALAGCFVWLYRGELAAAWAQHAAVAAPSDAGG